MQWNNPVSPTYCDVGDYRQKIFAFMGVKSMTSKKTRGQFFPVLAIAVCLTVLLTAGWVLRQENPQIKLASTAVEQEVLNLMNMDGDEAEAALKKMPKVASVTGSLGVEFDWGGVTFPTRFSRNSDDPQMTMAAVDAKLSNTLENRLYCENMVSLVNQDFGGYFPYAYYVTRVPVEKDGETVYKERVFDYKPGMEEELFTKAWVTGGTCGPIRFCFSTGMYDGNGRNRYLSLEFYPVNSERDSIIVSYALVNGTPELQNEA